MSELRTHEGNIGPLDRHPRAERQRDSLELCPGQRSKTYARGEEKTNVSLGRREHQAEGVGYRHRRSVSAHRLRWERGEEVSQGEGPYRTPWRSQGSAAASRPEREAARPKMAKASAPFSKSLPKLGYGRIAARTGSSLAVTEHGYDWHLLWRLAARLPPGPPRPWRRLLALR